jgi:nicotinamide-nucleotide amidase
MTDLSSPFPADLVARATELLQVCREAGLKIVTAESCTGGLIAALLTEIPGSSDVVERGFVTYSNEAKAEMIGVPKALIDAHGAVSKEVAQAMAEGALAHSRADIAVSVTGVAGPGGGTATKPVGLVHFGAARRDSALVDTEKHFGDQSRAAIRLASVSVALDLLLDCARLT